MSKKIVYIDMDDTIADFCGHPAFEGKKLLDVSHMYNHGFFFDLKPMKGALRAVRAIIRMGYDVQILTQPVAESAHSYSEKAQWIALHFPDLAFKINMTQDKGNFLGAYLIDDNAFKWKEKFEKNGGKFIEFKHLARDHEEMWNEIVEQLKADSLCND